MDYRYLVIGGGVQGTHLSLALLHAGVERASLAVLDSSAEPLERWNHTTRNCGMSWLRSSVVQNIDLAPLAIKRFAATQPRLSTTFYGRYNRPAHELFQRHVQHVIDSKRLAELRIRGRASTITRSNGSLLVQTACGTISTANVVLAVGNTENLFEPDWVAGQRQTGARIRHVFDPNFDAPALDAAQRYVIIGGASSAIQLALYLAQRFPGKVAVISPHPMRVAEFDYDALWNGPRGRRQLDAEEDPGRRRAMIEAAKLSCTIPSDVELELVDALATERLQLLVGRIEPLTMDTCGALSYVVQAENGTQSEIKADQTILATGFQPGCPQPELIGALARELGLPLAPCGFPLPARDLAWGQGMYVMGAHAELEIGPISRNIGGARRAAERIAAAVSAAG